MNFYGAAREDTQAIYDHLLEVRGMFDRAGRPTFFGDNMCAMARNMAFSRDAKFMTAFQDQAQDANDGNKIWRLHTYCWAASSALNVPGDFVECGVFRGLYSAVMLKYLNFEKVEKRMHLFDTFHGLSEEYSTADERAIVGNSYELEGDDWFEAVCTRFSSYSNVEVIKGVVPDVLVNRSLGEVALLHLDMNSGAAEVGALEVLFDRVADGGLILMDDYGRHENFELHHALDAWMTEYDHLVLELPTGQGLVIKRN